MGDNSDKPDILLNKLDSLMKSGRAENRSNTPPVLTEALPDNLQGQIPTLTDAVENRRPEPAGLEDQDEDPGKDPGEDQGEDRSTKTAQGVVASRLVASIDQEMTGLFAQFPALHDKLTVLHRSLKYALPQLVRIRWDDNAADSGTENDTGKTPDV
jgi:hypothetical protein